MSAYYRLFKRQWERGSIKEKDLDKAVEKEYITQDEKEDIMKK